MTDQMQIINPSEESIPCFIRKTYKILEDDKYSDVISWNEDGNAIVIKNPTEFAQTILPAYFKHNNLNSFIRQLNMYDFHKKKTPDGEHVYYHELFQRGRRDLLKNIKRKNAESSVLSNEKSRIGYELVKTKQDIAAIINENMLLKKINKEALATINSLEAKVNEVTIQNQALLSQILKYNEKDEILQTLIPSFKRESTPFPLSNIDINAPFENLDNKIAQTTTRIPTFSGEAPHQRNWNLLSENFEGNVPPPFTNISIPENKTPTIEDKRKRDQRSLPKSKGLGDPNFAADLSQQIVKNMDQELQYLKQLTSSNPRSGSQAPVLTSPEANLLGKRRMETETGQQAYNTYENFNRIYKPDSLLGLNFFSNMKPEGGDIGHEDR